MPEIGERIFVKPAAGRRVQRGDRLYGQFLPAAGVEVVWDEFLAKRNEEGDLVLPTKHYHAQRGALSVCGGCGRPDAHGHGSHCSGGELMTLLRYEQIRKQTEPEPPAADIADPSAVPPADLTVPASPEPAPQDTPADADPDATDPPKAE